MFAHHRIGNAAEPSHDALIVFNHQQSKMPPRLNKRQQRALEELEALGPGQDSDREEEESVQKNTVFSNFLSAEEIESESDDEGLVKPAKSRKKKKKKATSASPLPVQSQALTPSRSPASPAGTPALPRNEKKALKKARAKEKKAGHNELEKALAELSLTHPDIQKSPTSSASSLSLATLLSVSLPHLDSEAEMRKFFGAKVVQANKSKTSSSGSPSSSSRRQAAVHRSTLTRPQRTWWSPNQREGLSIRVLTSEEMDLKRARYRWFDDDDDGEEERVFEEEEKWWTVEYSQRYKSMTKTFIRAVMSGHPEALWDALRRLPWHADNLLQLAEIYRHREEYAQAVDFVDRALFAYERAFVGAFTFTSGTNRLDFDRVENRPFFLAVHRQTADLQRRGCVRTAFEFARLLYGLDPWTDPHGALFHLELLALKSGMHRWLLDLYDYFARPRGHWRIGASMDPSVLPGFLYARALALKMEEDNNGDKEHDCSSEALKASITSFPSIVPLLADKLDVTLPTAIRAHRDFKVETDASFLPLPESTLHLLSHLYVQRSSGLWKDPEHTRWFTSVVTSTFASLPPPSKPLPTTKTRMACLSLLSNETIRASIYRHVVVLETTTASRRLSGFIPARVLEDSATSLACDPLPPTKGGGGGGVSRYDDAFFRGVDELFSVRQRATRREREVAGRRLAEMVPDAEARRQLEAVMGMPEVAAQFPGGVMEMLEVMGEAGIEELLMQVANAGGGGGGGGGGGADEWGGNRGRGGGGDMPGQMPGMEVLEEEVGGVPLVGDQEGEEEGHEEEEEEEESAIPRVIRNMFARFWGQAPVADHSSSSSEDEAEDMENIVD